LSFFVAKRTRWRGAARLKIAGATACVDFGEIAIFHSTKLVKKCKTCNFRAQFSALTVWTIARKVLPLSKTTHVMMNTMEALLSYNRGIRITGSLQQLLEHLHPFRVAQSQMNRTGVYRPLDLSTTVFYVYKCTNNW
jgi:hypothetical protein